MAMAGLVMHTDSLSDTYHLKVHACTGACSLQPRGCMAQMYNFRHAKLQTQLIKRRPHLQMLYEMCVYVRLQYCMDDVFHTYACTNSTI